MAEVDEMVQALRSALDRAEQQAQEATQGPWFYNGYSGIASEPMLKVDDAFWTDERLNDGHSYDHRVGQICEACGERPALHPDGTRFGTYWDCARYTDAYNADMWVASVPAHHGDTAIGKRIKDAQHIALFDPPAVLATVQVLRILIDNLTAILADHEPYKLIDEFYCSSCGDVPQVPFPCDTYRRAVAGFEGLAQLPWLKGTQ